MLRSDYIAPLEDLDLPRLHQVRNWKEIGLFPEPAFFGRGIKEIGPGLMARMLKGASEIEEIR